MTGSLLDKLLFLLDEIWFILSKHVNSQNNTHRCFKNLPAVHDIPLCDFTVRVEWPECTNSRGPMQFGETSYIKLILAKLFTVVTDDRETVQKKVFFFLLLLLQELNVNFEGNVNISRREVYHLSECT
jgi:hypothetical protein